MAKSFNYKMLEQYASTETDATETEADTLVAGVEDSQNPVLNQSEIQPDHRTSCNKPNTNNNMSDNTSDNMAADPSRGADVTDQASSDVTPETDSSPGLDKSGSEALDSLEPPSEHGETPDDVPPPAQTYTSAIFGFMGSVYTTVKTQLAPRAYEFVTQQVAPRALYVMKRVLRDVPEGWADDSDEEAAEWRECKLEDSEDENEDERRDEDAEAEEVKRRVRIHNICMELKTTEEVYVSRLAILVMVKQKTARLVNTDVANNMFKDIEVIYQFHQENLLPELRERLEHWDKHQKIGDIMKKLTPFLKLYTEYVKNFQAANSLVETWEERSSGFKQILKDVREDKQYGRLRIQAHMLEPVQRVPRYELLLADYLKRLPTDSDDRENTEKALEQVSQAAQHFEEMMKRDVRILELVQLQSLLDGSVNIVNSSRELLKKGKVMTVSAKNSKSMERTAFLFNDLLLIADQVSSRLSAKRKVKQVIDLRQAQVVDGNNIEVPNTFYIKTKDTVVEICLSTPDEKDEWQKAIQKQMSECTKKKLIRQGSKKVQNPVLRTQSIGKRAPVLVHQNDVTMCMICGAAFSALKKKKHCRGCGNVVCAKCSTHVYPLEYDDSKPQRVCDECFVILEDKAEAKASPKLTKKSKMEGECLQRGYLQLSSDNGKTWKKRWFSIHDNFIVYSFRAPQDIHPLTSMSLNGYLFSVDETTTKKDCCIKLEGMGKSYFLSDDDPAVMNRWIETFTNLDKLSAERRQSIASFDSTIDFDKISIDSVDSSFCSDDVDKTLPKPSSTENPPS